MSYFNLPTGYEPASASNCTSEYLPAPRRYEPVTSSKLDLDKARNLINAEAFAASIGTPLTVHITTHFRLSNRIPVDDPRAFSAAHGTWLRQGFAYLRKRGIETAYLWVLENGPNKGLHSHCLAHVPHELWGDFKTELLHLGRFHAPENGMTDEAIRFSGGQYGMLVPSMRKGALRYALKGISDRALDRNPSGRTSAAKTLGIVPKAGLPVIGKRSGTSATIGHTARAAAGWQEAEMLAELAALLSPEAV